MWDPDDFRTPYPGPSFNLGTVFLGRIRIMLERLSLAPPNLNLGSIYPCSRIRIMLERFIVALASISVLRIHEILVRIPDPNLWLMDPDPDSDADPRDSKTYESTDPDSQHCSILVPFILLGSGWCLSALPWPWRRPWRRSWVGSGWCQSDWRGPPDGAASPRAQSPRQGSPATRREIIKLKLDQRWANPETVCPKRKGIFGIRRLAAVLLIRDVYHGSTGSRVRIHNKGFMHFEPK